MLEAYQAFADYTDMMATSTITITTNTFID